MDKWANAIEYRICERCLADLKAFASAKRAES